MTIQELIAEVQLRSAQLQAARVRLLEAESPVVSPPAPGAATDDLNLPYFPHPHYGGAIGEDPIGGFAIGGQFYDWQATIISQYANSGRILGVIASFAAAMEQKTNIDAWYDKLWNVDTAEGYGLDVWGRIVVIKRTLQVSSRFLGFEEGGPDYDPFNVSPFYAGGGATQNVDLSDDAYRVLILAKALANITFGSVPGINNILQQLFPARGPCYVTDNQDMTMTYVFGFLPTPVELAIITGSNVLPRPTGVKVDYQVL